MPYRDHKKAGSNSSLFAVLYPGPVGRLTATYSFPLDAPEGPIAGPSGAFYLVFRA